MDARSSAPADPVEQVTAMPDRAPDGTAVAPRGLAGVAVTDTRLGGVRGEEGFFHYRCYSAVELARHRTLEDVWFLLFEGRLPDAAERAAFLDEVAPLRRIPGEVVAALPAVARAGASGGDHGGGATPLDALRTAVSLTAAVTGMRPWLDVDAATLRRDALRLCAVTPSLVAALERLRHGEAPVEPRPDLPSAAGYLHLLTGEVPDPGRARALERYLVATVDHGLNASTFAARVIASTGADLGAAVVGAIGALSGPLHGGAPSRALDLLDAIGTPGRAEAHVRDLVERGERVMGFGHRVYRTDDPRSLLLRDVARELAASGGTAAGAGRVALAEAVERTVVDVLTERKPGRGLYANVEFYAGVVLEGVGLPRALFTPTFAVSRVIGWCAHVLEQAADNRIFRPTARYVGPPPPQPVPAGRAG